MDRLASILRLGLATTRYTSCMKVLGHRFIDSSIGKQQILQLAHLIKYEIMIQQTYDIISNQV